MKIKGFVLFVALILFLSTFVSSVEFNISSSFKQGETIITKISGNFLVPLTKNNIFFYKGHTKIPMDYGIEKIINEYYLYASLLGKSEGNYSVAIENARYTEGTKTLTESIARNFYITNETADFSVKPGVVVSSGEFSLEVQNLKDATLSLSVRCQESTSSERDISIIDKSTGATEKTSSISLSSGQTKKIYFSSGTGYLTFQKIELKTSSQIYEVPVYIFSSSLPSNIAYSIEPPELILSIPTGNITKKTLFIYNTGDSEIKNISLSLSDAIKPFTNLSQYYISNIPAKSNIPIELSFLSPGETEASGTLKADINSEDIIYSQISLKFLSNYVPPNETNIPSSVKTCAELQGKICDDVAGETCDTGFIYAKDDKCCVGNCTSSVKGSSTGIIIAIVIIAVLVAVGFWFYMRKYKGAKSPIDLLKIARGKGEK